MTESTLHIKLLQVRSAFGAVEKTGTNTGVGDGYKFVEAGRLSQRLLELFAQHGLTMFCVAQDVRDIRPTPSGKQITFTLWTRWRLTDSTTGEFLEVESFGQGSDNSDKALPKAQTNAMKYAILLLIQRAGDDPERDGNTDRIEESHAEQARARTAARRAAQAGGFPAESPTPGVSAAVPPTAPVPQAVETPALVERAVERIVANGAAIADAVVEAVVAEPRPARAVALATPAKLVAIRARAREVGLENEKLKAMTGFLVGVKSSKEWTAREADKILAKLEDESIVSMFRDDVVAVGEGVAPA